MTERIAEHVCPWSCGDFWLAVAGGACLFVLAALWWRPRT